ncbi:MAG TPA: hypothetical protein VN915_02320 [Elusimicrobiota bacterium]|nr:hypothetical protein [Elusimicrobiota bacterium]
MPRVSIVAATLCVVATAAATVSASAEVRLQGVHWQVGRVEAGRVASWQDARALPRGLNADERLRARLVLENDGAGAEEGLLLRYSLVARVKPDAAAAGVWAVPFDVDEKRVPKVGAGKVLEVPLDASPAIELYLRRAARSGWSADRFKISVMLEPHRGCKDLQLVEDQLELGTETKKP